MNDAQLMNMRVTALNECEVPARYQKRASRAWKLAYSALEDQAFSGREIRREKRQAFKDIRSQVHSGMGLTALSWLFQPFLMAVVNRIVAFVFNQWLETEGVE